MFERSEGELVVDERFKKETERLPRSWMRYGREVLRDYLVQDVEDPRINVQSILTRHFLTKGLLGERFRWLMEQELRFGVVMNWLNKLVKTAIGPERFNAVLDALLDGADHAEELDIPRCVSEAFSALPGEVNGIVVPDYISDLLIWAPTKAAEATIPEYILATFQVLWGRLLENERCERLCVLEPACGSANDYRFIEAFGIGRLLDYTGFDLCEKNIQNARQMFPNVRFEMGNVLEIDAPDNSFDCCFMHDLFEHLSSEAMEVAIAEICRVTRQDMCVGFFNMHEGDKHLVKTVDDYHWNTLSMSRTRATFERFVCEVQVIHIETLLISQFGYDKTHNKGAYTFIIKM